MNTSNNRLTSAPIKNVANHSVTHAECCGQLPAGFLPCVKGSANLTNIIGTEFFEVALGVSNPPVPNPRCHPSARNGVLSVVFSGANNQMKRVATGRVVTPMADLHAVRDGTVYERPRESMRVPRLSLAPELIDVGAVTVRLPGAPPRPAPISPLYQRPEPLTKWAFDVFAPVLPVANHARNLASAHVRYK